MDESFQNGAQMPEIKLPPGLVEDVRHGRGVLVWSWMSRGSPPALGLRLARQLPFRVFITTDQDDSLVRVLERAGRQPVVVAVDADIASWDESRTTVIQLYNAESRPKTLLHYQHYHEKETPKLLELVRGIFATRVVLLAHWDPRDKALKLLYRAIARDFVSHRPSVYALITTPLCKADETHWRGMNHWHLWQLPGELERDPVELFLLSLIRAAHGATAIHRHEPPSPAELGSPYKHLDYFEEGDEHLFFGRDAESRQLAELALTHRLLLLFGPSGAGKTSLIRAGASPHLRRWGVEPLYVRPANDAVQALKNALRQGEPTGLFGQVEHSEEQNPTQLEPGVKHHPTYLQRLLRSVHRQHRTPTPIGNKMAVLPARPEIHLRQRLHDTIRHEGKKLVIFMDQFEELLTGTSDQVQRRSAKILGELVNDRSIDWHLIVSIREDFLAELHGLSPWLPGLFDHRMRLQSLSHDAARAAIAEPADVHSLGFEDGLVDAILDDLTTAGRVEPPQLQIVCFSLWRDLQERKATTFSRVGYERLGKAQEILVAYLKDALTTIVAQETTAEIGRHDAETRRLLEALIVSKRTRTPITVAEAVQEGKQDLENTKRIIQELADDGLVTCLSDLGKEYYELSDEAAALMERHKVAAEKVLKSLITSERTKALLTMNDVAQRTKLDILVTKRLLQALVSNRLLRGVSGTEGEAYELCHEHLVPEIASWLDEDEKQAKQIQDMLQAELHNWRNLELVMGGNSLELLERGAKNPSVNPSQEELELWLRSTLRYGANMELSWLDRMTPDRVFMILEEAWNKEAVDAKARAVEIACALGQRSHKTTTDRGPAKSQKQRVEKHLQQAILSLALKASRDEDPSVRLAALDAFSQKCDKGREILARVAALRRDRTEQVRLRATQVLGELNPVQAKNLHILDHVQPMLIASALTIATVMGICISSATSISREAASWQIVLYAIGVAWILYLNAERQIHRIMLLLLNSGFLILIVSSLMSGTHTILEQPNILASALENLGLAVEKTLELWGLLLRVLMQALVVVAFLLAAALLWASFVSKESPVMVLQDVLRTIGGTQLITYLARVRSRALNSLRQAWHRVEHCRQRIAQIAPPRLRDWPSGATVAITQAWKTWRGSLRLMLGATVTNMRNASYRRDFFRDRIFATSGQICKSILWLILRITVLTAASLSNGAILAVFISVLVYLYFLVPETHQTVFSAMQMTMSDMGSFIVTMQNWLRVFLEPSLTGQIGLIVAVSILILAGLRFLLRLPFILLVNLFVILMLCWPLIFIPSVVRSELIDWANISGLSEYWRELGTTMQPWLANLPASLRGIDFIISEQPQANTMVMLGVALMLLLFLTSVVQEGLAALLRRPILLLALFLPFVLSSYQLGQVIQTIWYRIPDIAHAWLPTLRTSWMEMEPAWDTTISEVNFFVTIAILGLLLLVIISSAKLLLTPVLAPSSIPIYAASLLCFIPALYAHAQGITSNMFLLSTSIPIIALCLLTWFPCVSNNLRGQQPMALRVLGASVGCMISISLATVWISRSAAESLPGTALNGLSVGAIAAATALAGFAGTKKADTQHTCVRLAFGMVLIGPIAWILVTVVSVGASEIANASQSLLSWVYVALARFGWINVLMAAVFSCAAARHWLGEHRTMSDRLNALFLGLRQRGIWTKLRVTQGQIAKWISEIWQWLTPRTGILRKLDVRLPIWQQSVQAQWDSLSRAKATWTQKWDITRHRVLAGLGLRSKRSRLIVSLVIWVALAIAGSLAALSALVWLLSSIRLQWGLNDKAILSVGELVMRILHDYESVAYALGLFGGLGFAELLIARKQRIDVHVSPAHLPAGHKQRASTLS